MADNSINNIIQSMFKGLDGVISTKTVVGEPTKVSDDTVIVPFVDISFGMGAGNVARDKQDGGAGGISGKMTPSAVLVMNNGTTRLVSIKNQDSVGKIIDMIPDIVNKAAAKKNINISDSTAVSEGFADGLDDKPLE